MSETYEPWDPTGRISTPCAGALIEEDDNDLRIRLLFSQIVGGPVEDLLLATSWHLALMSHQEIAHPSLDGRLPQCPRLTGRWENYCFPLIVVRESSWMASFPDSRLAPDGRTAFTHYRIITLDRTVDLLTARDVKAEWGSPLQR